MKKLLVLLVSAILVLAGCSNDSFSVDEPTTITYMSWSIGTEEQNTVERQMIAAYEEANPNVTVEIVDPGADYAATLNTLAASGDLPDVFMIPNVTDAVTNGWLLDITEFVSEDFYNVVPALQDGATAGEQIVAIPCGLQIMGFWVNNDVVEAYGFAPLAYGYTQEEFDAVMQGTTDPENGVVGLAENVQLPDVYPAFNEGTMYGAYDATSNTYKYDSAEYIAGIEYAASVMPYTFAALTDEQKALAGASADNGYFYGDAWNAGNIALRYDGIWSANEWYNVLGMNVSYIGLPGGKSIVTGDYYGVASTTENPEVAVNFAEWMGYTGYAKSVELYNASEKAVGSTIAPPAIASEENVTLYDDAMGNIPGVKEALMDLEDAVLEPVKTVPGYVQSRWEAPTGITVADTVDASIGQVIDAAARGELNFNDYAAQINEIANAKHEEATAAITPAPTYVAPAE